MLNFFIAGLQDGGLWCLVALHGGLLWMADFTPTRGGTDTGWGPGGDQGRSEDVQWCWYTAAPRWEGGTTGVVKGEDLVPRERVKDLGEVWAERVLLAWVLRVGLGPVPLSLSFLSEGKRGDWKLLGQWRKGSWVDWRPGSHVLWNLCKWVTCRVRVSLWREAVHLLNQARLILMSQSKQCTNKMITIFLGPGRKRSVRGSGWLAVFCVSHRWSLEGLALRSLLGLRKLNLPSMGNL